MKRAPWYRYFVFGLTLASLIVGAPALRSQDFRALIIGQVTDPTGAAVPNATIAAVKPDTGQTFSTKTNPNGAYSLPYIPPGVYNVSAEAPAFKKMVRENITLAVADKRTLDFQLELGAVTQEVTVTAAPPLVETATASGGTVFDPEKTQSLPLNGRQAYMLLQLTPGVMFTQTQFGATGFSGTRGWDVNGSYTMNGGWTGQNQFLLNGAPISVAGTWHVAPNVDAIQEFKVMINTYDAQYGRTSGGTVNTTLKSGANAVHGTLFDYHRNSALDANTFTNNLVAADRGKHIVHQWGGTVGGPIRKNKTFYYGSFEGWRERVPFPKISSAVPPYMRPGPDGSVDLSQFPSLVYDPLTTRCVAGKRDAQGRCSEFERLPFPNRNGQRTRPQDGIIPASRIDPVAANILKLYPLPNAPGCIGPNVTKATCPDTDNFFATANIGKYSYNQPMVRVDHIFSEANRMYALVTWQRGHEDRSGNGFSIPAEIGEIISERDDTNAIFDFTHVFSPSKIGDLRVSFGRFHSRFPDGERDFDFTADQLGIKMPDIPTTTRRTAPRIAVDRYNDIIGNTFSENVDNYWNIAPSITHSISSHTLHYGAEISDREWGEKGVGRPRGNFSFGTSFTQKNPRRRVDGDGSGAASLLLGFPTGGGMDWNDPRFERWWYYGAYIQDDFRVSKNLTLNLGLRWDIQTSLKERYNRVASGFCFTCANPLENDSRIASSALLTHPLRGGLVFPGVEGRARTPYNNYFDQWQPRVGFAWAVRPRTVLRGGLGLYYSFGDQKNVAPGFNQRTDYITSLDDGLTPFRTSTNSLSNPYPNGAEPPTGASLGLSTSLGRGVSFDLPTRRVPRAWHYSFGVQQELPGHILLDVKYSGSKTNRMTLNTQWDVITEAQRAQGQSNPAFLDTLLPNPFFGILPITSPLGRPLELPAWRFMRSYPEFDGVTEFTNPGARAFYDSLQVRGEKRIYGTSASRGLTFILAYTWSKEFEQNHYLNNGSFRDEKPIYEVAFFDRTHNVAFSGVWNLPIGKGQVFASNASGILGGLLNNWAFDWIFTYGSGVPTGWPDADFSCSDYKVPDRAFAQWFNNDVSCYKERARWTRRVVPDRFPWIHNHWEPQLSTALQKRFSMTERLGLQFRVEAFNVTNTPIFPGPNLDFTKKPELKSGRWTGFGTVNLQQQNFPRNIQVSAKILF